MTDIPQDDQALEVLYQFIFFLCKLELCEDIKSKIKCKLRFTKAGCIVCTVYKTRTMKVGMYLQVKITQSFEHFRSSFLEARTTNINHVAILYQRISLKPPVQRVLLLSMHATTCIRVVLLQTAPLQKLYISVSCTWLVANFFYMLKTVRLFRWPNVPKCRIEDLL